MEAIAIVQVLNPITLSPMDFTIFNESEYENPYEEALSLKEELYKVDWTKGMIITIGGNKEARVLKTNIARANFNMPPKDPNEID